MTRKKLLAILLMVAMLTSLSIPAFATDPDPAQNSDPAQNQNQTPAATYSYSATSDPFVITNRSNVDVDVKVEVLIGGMNGVTFADNADCKNGNDVIPDSLYLALLAEKTDAVALPTDPEAAVTPATPEETTNAVNSLGYVSVSKKLVKAAEGAYKWQTNNNQYAYALRSDLATGTDSAEFSKLSLKMTGAVSSEGWESFSGSPTYTVTWTCTTPAKAETRISYDWDDDNDSSSAPTVIYWSKVDKKFYAASSGDTAPQSLTQPTSGEIENKLPKADYLTTNKIELTPAPKDYAGPRISYKWDNNGTKTEIFWDKGEKKFYTTADGTTAFTNASFTAPTAGDIGTDNLPTETYCDSNNVTKTNTDVVRQQGSSSNDIVFEGNAPADIVDMDIPTSAANVFQFILDPNGRIKETEAENYDGATFDFTNSKGLFFANLYVYNGPTATVTNAAAAANDIVTITLDYGESGMNTVTTLTYTNASGTSATGAFATSNPTFTKVSDTEVKIKAVPAVFGNTQKDWALTLSDGTETMSLPIDITTNGDYTLPAGS
jgi:hypothetical protein